MPTLADIAELLEAPAPSGAAQQVRGIATIEDATSEELTFVATDAYAKLLPDSRAAGAIVHRKVQVPPGYSGVVFRVDDADLAVSKVLELFAPPVPRPPCGIDPLARVASSAQVEQDAAIGPFVFVGERVRIGRGSVLHPGVFIGDDVALGDACEIFPQVVIRERVTVGHRVIIHAGSVIGSDGFGYRWDGSKHAKVPQIGTVVIEDDVEIGSCVCVDRAKFAATRIGRGTKIDNLVQIAHNVQIGPNCIIVGQTGLAGSVTLGAGVVLGGQAAVRDHITIGDGAMAGACAAIAEDIPPKAVFAGAPALPHRQWLREQGALRHLPELRNQVKKLQEELDRLRTQSKE